MSLFDGKFGGVQTRIIYADEVSEYVKSGLDELDELSMLRLTKLRDPRGKSLSKAMSLAHSERSRPLGMPFQPPVSTQQFPQLTPAMDNLITTLVWAGVLDGEDMTSLIKSGRTSPAANRPDEGESSGSDRDRVRHADEEAHILYGLSLDTEAKVNSSEVTGAPRRKIGRGEGELTRGQDPGETAAFDANSDKFAKTRRHIDRCDRRNDPFERHRLGFSTLPDLGGTLWTMLRADREVPISHKERR